MKRLDAIGNIWKMSVPLAVPLSLLSMAFLLIKIFNTLQHVARFDDFIPTKIDSVYIDNHPDEIISFYHKIQDQKRYIYIIGSVKPYTDCLGDCENVIQFGNMNDQDHYNNIYALNVPVFYSQSLKQAYYIAKGKSWARCTLFKEIIIECGIIVILVSCAVYGLILSREDHIMKTNHNRLLIYYIILLLSTILINYLNFMLEKSNVILNIIQFLIPIISVFIFFKKKQGNTDRSEL